MSTKIEVKPSRLVISQPMFLPWRGMFEQIKLCSQFVFYDDVQLPLGGGRGRGFSTRVQIKTARGIDWLSLPVMRAGKGRQLINEACFAHVEWKKAHLSKILQAYKTAPYFDSVYESMLIPIYAIETENLAEFCIQSMKMLWTQLGFSPEVYLSSALNVPDDIGASERVLEICKRLGADEYVSGLGAMKYIDYAIFEEANVRVNYMNYLVEPYPQLHGDFTPYVSIIDMLFCVGVESTSASLKSLCLYWKDWPHRQSGRPVSLSN
jgi:hypothetical protein